MPHHEVITIQTGGYSNMIGAYWWNMQEGSFCFDATNKLPLNIHHDVLFREGVNHRNESTFLPRLVCIDTKENFKRTLNEDAQKLDSNKLKDEVLWDGTIDVLNSSATERLAKGDHNSDVQHATESVEQMEIIEENDVTWSSVLNFDLHQRSIAFVERSDINVYAGDTSTSEGYMNSIEDNIRFYVEECDYLQGFQMLMDGDNDFVSVSGSVLLHLSDEYSKKTCIAFPVYENAHVRTDDGKDKERLVHHLYSVLTGWNNMINTTSLFNPLSLSTDLSTLESSHVKFPFLDYNPSSLYHGSSILAAAIESITSPYRLREDTILLSDLAENMVLHGRKMTASSMAFPYCLQDYACFPSLLKEKSSKYSLVPLTPLYDSGMYRSLTQSAVFRGFPNRYFEKHASKGVVQDVDEICGRYLSMYSPSSISMLKVIEEKCTIPKSYPDIFVKDLFENQSQLAPKSCGINTVSAIATLSNNDSSFKLLDRVLAAAKTNIFRNTSCPFLPSIVLDDFNEVIHNVVSMKEDYSPSDSLLTSNLNAT